MSMRDINCHEVRRTRAPAAGRDGRIPKIPGGVSAPDVGGSARRCAFRALSCQKPPPKKSASSTKDEDPSVAVLGQDKLHHDSS